MDRILIADDDPLICRTISLWLQAEGYDTVSAHTGDEAIRIIRNDPPALILLDLVLPDLTGIAVCGALKSEEALMRIPVIILTGAGASGDRVKSLDAGADDFISKPVDRVELMARVRSLLRAKHLSDRLLISYHELDKLGTFAETFVGQPVADWDPGEVAISMSRQVLGMEPGLPEHPTLTCGVQDIHGEMVGILSYYRGAQWCQSYLKFKREDLERKLQPSQRGDGIFLSRTPPSNDLRHLLNIPTSLHLSNFIAVLSENKFVLVAGYPWEVGTYEIPLIRALLRHWKVFERIRLEAKETQEAFFYTLETLAVAAEYYDPVTASHIRRVASYCSAVARTLGCDRKFVKMVKRCSVTHDVGKFATPAEILKKKGPLTDAEKLVMQNHTIEGAKLLGGAAQLSMARNIARSHHENFDGTGYPDGLAEDQIPLEARIVKVVDIYDALRSLRSYKEPLLHEEALQILKNGDHRVRPSHLDSRVLEAFLDVHSEIGHIYEQIQNSAAAHGSYR